jgi:antitoxin component YwqK of YwqJK toxin-antitoxin module
MHNLDFQATTYPNGRFESQTMCNEDKTDGFRVHWYESGQMKSAAEYKHGKPDGLYTAWYENGNKSAEINYLNGRRHGTCKLWHKDSLKHSEVAYDNGRMNDLWVVWHSTGQIRKAILFKDCRKTSAATWYSNGNIKYNSELGDEYFNRRICEFSNINYGEWIDYYSPHPSGFEFPHNGSDLLSGGVRYPILMTYWYKSGQKSYECIQYGYEDSTIHWYENGQKSFEAGKNRGDPNIYWDDHGIKEYECLYDFDSDELVDWKIVYKFFDNEHHVATVIQTEDFDNFIQWEFFDTLDNKLYEYKYSYPKGVLITDDELWDVWLNSECKEFVKTLKSVEKYKSVFCKIYKHNLINSSPY